MLRTIADFLKTEYGVGSLIPGVAHILLRYFNVQFLTEAGVRPDIGNVATVWSAPVSWLFVLLTMIGWRREAIWDYNLWNRLRWQRHLSWFLIGIFILLFVVLLPTLGRRVFANQDLNALKVYALALPWILAISFLARGLALAAIQHATEERQDCERDHTYWNLTFHFCPEDGTPLTRRVPPP